MPDPMTQPDSGTPTGAPVRLCCYQRHYGPVCPDGKVMCELCSNRFDITDLKVDDEGTWDICKGCDRDA